MSKTRDFVEEFQVESKKIESTLQQRFTDEEVTKIVARGSRHLKRLEVCTGLLSLKITVVERTQ